MINTKIFIEKAKQIHGDKYDYSKSKYIDTDTKVCIICPEHGEFWQTPHDHLDKHGCPTCGGRKKQTTEEFIEKAKQVHGDKYDYSKANYINNHTKIEIICLEHGSFRINPKSFLKGYGCKKCSSLKRTQTTEEFIEKAKQVHGDKYDYSNTFYVNKKNKIAIICKKCGKKFFQIPAAHLQGHGCPLCKFSKGEAKISSFLRDNNINYKYNLACLPFLGKLRPDFYLPDYNLVIEYDGRQHFEAIDHFGGTKRFLQQQEEDFLKTKLCEENDIVIIRIPYIDYENIENILTDILLGEN